MDDTDVMNVCLIGHSFVTRLHRYIQSNGRLRNLNLDMDNFRISVCARGGFRVAQLISTKFLYFSSVPRMCLNQIGENDISLFDCTTLTRDIISLALYLLEGLGISVVIIGQLLCREPWASPRDFNQRNQGKNRLLKEKCAKQEAIYFWHHKGFWNELHFLGRDGVHLQNPHPSVNQAVPSSPMQRAFSNFALSQKSQASILFAYQIVWAVYLIAFKCIFFAHCLNSDYVPVKFCSDD